VPPTPPTGKARPALETYWGVLLIDQVSTKPAVRLRQILAHVLCLAILVKEQSPVLVQTRIGHTAIQSNVI
jgi:hypothetical protein